MFRPDPYLTKFWWPHPIMFLNTEPDPIIFWKMDPTYLNTESGSDQNTRIWPDPDPQVCLLVAVLLPNQTLFFAPLLPKQGEQFFFGVLSCVLPIFIVSPHIKMDRTTWILSTVLPTCSLVYLSIILHPVDTLLSKELATPSVLSLPPRCTVERDKGRRFFSDIKTLLRPKCWIFLLNIDLILIIFPVKVVLRVTVIIPNILPCGSSFFWRSGLALESDFLFIL